MNFMSSFTVENNKSSVVVTDFMDFLRTLEVEVVTTDRNEI